MLALVMLVEESLALGQFIVVMGECKAGTTEIEHSLRIENIRRYDGAFNLASWSSIARLVGQYGSLAWDLS